MSDNERSRSLQRHTEFLDTHIIFTNMVSLDRDPEKRGAHTWLMLERMSFEHIF
jgi:hypothetical protein